ncbi:MAG TPA: glucose-1-phosphate adenylyltransferase subunit GlgD [Clostridia bacterium]|nr:glucose-1-phosphate adenylyltransferase subunit GlgD [Clostridia bacterium]
MFDYMGIIDLCEREESIRELTYHRPIASIPFAGRYRVIDFTLSNLVNAGVQNISIFTQNKYRSLLDHLGTGKAWDLDRKNDGMFIMTPMFDYYTLGISRGNIENFKNHIDYIHLSKQNNVILTGSNMICNLNYNAAVKHHNETGADITMVYKYAENCGEDFRYCNVLTVDGSGRITGVDTNMGRKSEGDISMNMFIMKKSLFLDIVHTCVSRGDCDFFKEAVHKNLDNFKVFGYKFDGYLASINSTQNYYKASMQLLDLGVSKELFFSNGLIYTKVKDEPPTKYASNARVVNSLVANGCIIDGQVENSIVFRGVKIKKGAVIKNSIVMQNCLVEEDSLLRNVILDKGVRITREKQLKGDESHPTIIEKKAII